MENYPITGKFLKKLQEEKPYNVFDLSNLLKENKKNKIEKVENLRKSYTSFNFGNRNNNNNNRNSICNSNKYQLGNFEDFKSNDNSVKKNNEEIKKNYDNLYKGKITKKVFIKYPKSRNEFLNNDKGYFFFIF